MVAVREVDLTQFGVVLPNNRVGVVALQPRLVLTAIEPFKVEPGTRPQQLAAINKTLQVALLRDHGEQKTHFTLFPELSIPGMEGVAAVEQTMSLAAWPLSTFVIGGVHGLTKDEYQELCSSAGANVEPVNAFGQVPEDRWVNCMVTWVKDAQGHVRKWIQPKICPAWVEQNIMHHHMFRGRSVYVFKARFANNSPCRFFSLICFDWVGAHDGVEIVPQVLQEVGGLAGGENVDLHWMFILQCNESPNHPTFLARINQVLTQPGLAPTARRHDTCLVFSNISNRDTPGRSPSFGRTSFVFGPNAPLSIKDSCRPTYSGKSELSRGANTITVCKDTVLRENGPCIHSMGQNITSFMAGGAANRASSLEVASVHPWTAGIAVEPRIPGGAVPCCVKWVNDELDEIHGLDHPVPGCELAQNLPAAHTHNIASLRIMSSVPLQEAIECAACAASAAQSDADLWDIRQLEGLETVLDTVDIFRLAFGALDIGAFPGHASVVIDSLPYDLIAVRGEKHEECAVRVRDRVVARKRHGLMIVSRDRYNIPLLAKHKRIFDVAETKIGKEPKITEPDANVHISFSEVLQCFMEAQTRAELQVALNAKLAS